MVIRPLSSIQMSASASFPPASVSLRERAFGHFQREDGGLLAVLNGRVARDVQREGRLAHAGPRGDHDEFSWLESAGQLVEVPEACRHSGEFATAFNQLLDVVEGIVHLVVQTAESGARLLLPDLENLGFR